MIRWLVVVSCMYHLNLEYLVFNSHPFPQKHPLDIIYNLITFVKKKKKNLESRIKHQIYNKILYIIFCDLIKYFNKCKAIGGLKKIENQLNI